MSNYTSTRDLKNAVLDNCGELTDGSSQYESRVLTYLNKAYLAVHAGSSVFNIAVGDAWVWAKAKNPGILILREAQSQGLVSLVPGGTTGIFNFIPTESFVGWYINFTNESDWYQIKIHNAGQANFTLDSEYVGVETSQGFLMIKTDYDLNPGIMRLISPMLVDVQQGYPLTPGDSKIYGTNENRLMEEWPRRLIRQVVPLQFARTYEIDGQITVRFNSYVGNKTRVRYDYIPIPNDLVDSDTDIPGIPREFRDFMEYAASYKLLLDKDDDRAQQYFSMANAQIQALQNAERKEDSNSSKMRGRLVPRYGDYRWRRGRWYV